MCDTIVFVDTDDAVRRQRASSRGWSDDELPRREQNQLPLKEKRSRSQHVLDNNGDLTATARAVDDLLSRLATHP